MLHITHSMPRKNMQRKTHIVPISLIFIISLVWYPLVPADSQHNPPHWNNQWVYSQQIELPFSTNATVAHNQPVDIEFYFEYPCWTKNTNETSVRVCCWHQNQWFELASQIYNLVFKDANHIERCNIVFLIPSYADGKEQYFVYYHDNPTPIPQYKDHVCVKDAYYLESPVSDITAEARYYRIEEEGKCIYGVGQQGKLLDRSFSQIVVKQKKGVKDFDVFDADLIVSFAFSYYYGNKETDESSSDQKFIQKKIFTDGNLMVCFGIISESEKKDVRTTAIYKYYYNPTDDKRLNVHVKHEMLNDAKVQGIENVDGRFGAIVSFVSRNPVVDRLNFGRIFPYVHFYNTNNQIEEVTINQNPKSATREWILSYADNADLGNQAWFSFGEGKEGKTHAVIFPSNSNFLSSGTDERDGLQLKIAVKQYFNFLGTEVDYASINFGRNSYERGYSHDIFIPKNLVVDFHAEVYSAEKGGYRAVQNESVIYQHVMKSRKENSDSNFHLDQKKYNLTIITHLGGTRFSFPALVNKTGVKLPTMYVELYHEGQLCMQATTNRSLLFKSIITFSGLEEGRYLVKIYRTRDTTKILVGEKIVVVNDHGKVHIFCTWEKSIYVHIVDQNKNPVEDVYVRVYTQQGDLCSQEITDAAGNSTVKVAFNPKDSYRLQAWYKGVLIYEKKLNQSLKKLTLQIPCYLSDVTVTVTDAFDLPPGIPVAPVLLPTQTTSTSGFEPIILSPGAYRFTKIPAGIYTLKLEYSTFSTTSNVNIPKDGVHFFLPFSAVYTLTINFFDSTGVILPKDTIDLEIFRDNILVAKTTKHSVELPPATYTLKAYVRGEYIGFTIVELSHNRQINFITSLSSPVPIIILSVLLFLISVSLGLVMLKKISYIMLCKLFILACMLFSLIQPWWMLSGISTTLHISRQIKIFIYPAAMIETTTVNQIKTIEIAKLPFVFTGILEYIFTALLISIILFCISLFFDSIKKKRYSYMCMIVSILIIGVSILGFSIAAEKICEVSIGSIQGEGFLGMTIQGTSAMLNAQWGFSFGYYSILCAFILMILISIFEMKKIFYRVCTIVRKEKDSENKK